MNSFDSPSNNWLAGLFNDDTLLIIIFVIVIFLLQNLGLFKRGVSTLNLKVSTVRTLLEAVQATLNAVESVVDAPSMTLQKFSQTNNSEESL